jgi:protocatechuate 3,4-dioxygenase beta subunit
VQGASVASLGYMNPTPRTCFTIPDETPGPYPGDGSNGPNALALRGIVRSDIRSSIGRTGVVEGVPLTIALTLVNTRASCAPLARHAIYVWHCDRSGDYSMYSKAAKHETFLRGVQITDENGEVTFTSIFPAAYPDRWPHIHFEVYPSEEDARASRNKITTSQIALPYDACEDVYREPGYAGSIANLAKMNLAEDSVFGDGVSAQLATVTGTVRSGMTAELTIGIEP